MPRHCATCSRTESEAKFYGDFCEYCTRDKIFKGLPEEVKVRTCKRCERIWTGTRFTAPTKKAVEDALGLHIKGYSIKVLEFTGDTVKVELGEELKEGTITLEKEFKVKQDKVVCGDCYKRASGYWEACIQLRGGEAKVAKAAERIEKYVAHSGAFITKSEDAPNGIDIYVSNKKTVNEMLLYFHMKAVQTFTLYGVKQGRRVYRNTYSLHL
jgi:NMD protein affecting ribosome stability and mRNA decay